MQTRTCYTGSCSRSNGDFLIFVDLGLVMWQEEWNYVHSEAFYCAFSSVLNVRESSIALLNHTRNVVKGALTLHFEIRLRAKDFDDSIAFRSFAQSVPELIWQPKFRSDMISGLDECSKKIDTIDFSRYGYLLPKDLEIQNAMALPFGGHRDPADSLDGIDFIMNQIGSSSVNFISLLLLIVIATSLIACSCLKSHTRLRREYSLFESKKSGSHMKVYTK